MHTTEDVRALELAGAQAGVEHAQQGEHGIAFQAEERDVGELSLALGRAGIGVLSLTPELATLEDLFFRLTEGQLAGDEPVPPATEDPPELVQAR
jgi:hypothetical protein